MTHESKEYPMDLTPGFKMPLQRPRKALSNAWISTASAMRPRGWPPGFGDDQWHTNGSGLVMVKDVKVKVIDSSY